MEPTTPQPTPFTPPTPTLTPLPQTKTRILPAALVNVVTLVQSFYAITLGAILSILMPKVFKEDISRRNVSKKVIGAAIMIAGIYMLLV
jgi:hypothetical protein